MHWIRYTLWLIGQVISATAVVARDTVRIHNRHHPIVVYYPLRVTTDWERTVFSTSITMTPGTLSIGFRPVSEIPDAESASGLILLVHAVYGDNPREVVEGLADMEARVAPRIADTSVAYKPWMFAGAYSDGYRKDINFPMAEREDYWEPTNTDEHRRSRTRHKHHTRKRAVMDLTKDQDKKPSEEEKEAEQGDV